MENKSKEIILINYNKSYTINKCLIICKYFLCILMY